MGALVILACVVIAKAIRASPTIDATAHASIVSVFRN
jgi:hypothetical protein